MPWILHWGCCPWTSLTKFCPPSGVGGSVTSLARQSAAPIVETRSLRVRLSPLSISHSL